MELTVPARLKSEELLASPGMLVEPSTTIFLEDEYAQPDVVRRVVSKACLNQGVLSFRMDGEIVDVMEVMSEKF